MQPDSRILDLLKQDARLSYEQIALRLDLSVELVTEHIAWYESHNVIRGYSALIDEDNLPERSVRAVIEVSVEPERDTGFDRVARALARFSEVSDVILISGNYDLLLLVQGETLHQVADFVSSKLSPLKGVRSTRTHFLLKKYKESGISFHQEEEYERLKVTP
jgi:DNA-binding Lrp family transcriptional regulator